jgi:hypothetical protein
MGRSLICGQCYNASLLRMCITTGTRSVSDRLRPPNQSCSEALRKVSRLLWNAPQSKELNAAPCPANQACVATDLWISEEEQRVRGSREKQAKTKKRRRETPDRTRRDSRYHIVLARKADAQVSKDHLWNHPTDWG